MPVREIEACLRRLDPSGKLLTQFWAIEDHTEPHIADPAEKIAPTIKPPKP